MGPEIGPTSALSSCVPTGMRWPTCIFWANLAPFSLQRQIDEREAEDEAAAAREAGPEQAQVWWNFLCLRTSLFFNLHRELYGGWMQDCA